MITVCMFTAPRQISFLENSIKYLRLAKLNQKIYIFSDPQDKLKEIENTEIFYNPINYGLVINWREATKKIFSISNSEWFLFLEDDIECKYNSYEILVNFAKTIDKKIGMINGYLPKAYSISHPFLKNFNGWAKINRGYDNWGTQCVLIQRQTLLEFIESDKVQNCKLGFHSIDALLGEFTLNNNLDVYYSCPSLFEHVGYNYSTTNFINNTNCAFRYEENFSQKKELKSHKIIF